jgi:hypothetical protein
MRKPRAKGAARGFKSQFNLDLMFYRLCELVFKFNQKIFCIDLCAR